MVINIKSNKYKGRFGLAMAIAYFTDNGYTVSTPLNDTQWYDLIVEKDGVFKTVQCKCTDSNKNIINLRSCGGTNGGVYDNILNHQSLDYLFCIDLSGNMYLIPIEKIRQSGNTNQIVLRTKPTSNNQGFQTHLYMVKFSFDNNHNDIG